MVNKLQALATPAATSGVPLLVGVDQEGRRGCRPCPARGSPPSRQRSSRGPSQPRHCGMTPGRGGATASRPRASTSTSHLCSTPCPRTVRRPTSRSAATSASTARLRLSSQCRCQRRTRDARRRSCDRRQALPGLGRASGNTDTATGVKDTETTRHDATSTLRRGHRQRRRGSGDGVERDLYAHRLRTSSRLLATCCTDVAHRPRLHRRHHDRLYRRRRAEGPEPAQRAINFINAGGDLVLTTNPSDVASMVPAMLSKANSDSSFRAKVDASALRVLIAKQRVGLVAGGIAAAANGSHAVRGGADREARHRPLHPFRQQHGRVRRRSTATGAATPALTPAARHRGVEGRRRRLRRHGSPLPPIGRGSRRVSWTNVGGVPTSPPAVAAAHGGRAAVAVRNGTWGISVRDHTRQRLERAGPSWAARSTAPRRRCTYLPNGDLVVYALAQTQVVLRNVRHAGKWSGLVLARSRR